MAENNNDGCLFFFIILLRIVIPIYVGYKIWEMIQPESFFGFIVFLIVWGILTTVIQIISIGILSVFNNND